MIKNIIYKTIDLVTFGKGITRTFAGNKIKVITQFFRYFPVGYEEENFRIINSRIKSGMNVIDVGAHIGLMAGIIGKKVCPGGKVYAFEPTPTTFNFLKKTITINNVSDVVIPVQAALSNQTGETTFYISDNIADNSNSLVNNKRIDRIEDSIKVKLFSLDDFVNEEKLKTVDFVKIDAEGAELQVLKGGVRTFEKYHPPVILALHPNPIKNCGDSLSEIWDLVTQIGYKVILDSKEMNRDEFIGKDDLFDVLLEKKQVQD